MLTQEEFKVIADKISNKEALSLEDSESLIKVMTELDANMYILQNALQLSVDNATEVIPAVAEQVLKFSGRTDSKIKKKTANFCGEIVARFELALQMYVAQSHEEVQRLLSGETPTKEEGETNE